MPEPFRYAYVTTTAHSGTTLLAMLLDSHPRIGSIGELDNIIPGVWPTPYHCSCGQPILECPFFCEVRARLAQGDTDLDLYAFRTRLGLPLGLWVRRAIFGTPQGMANLRAARDRILLHVPAYRRHVDEVFDRSTAIARSVIEVGGKDIFADTSKFVGRVRHLARRPEVRLRVIHIVRDLRAVVWSHVKRSKGTETKTARNWNRVHSEALRLPALVGEHHYLRFRWEDFCANPADVLDQICRFLGVDSVDLVARVDRQPHHVIGNRIRLEPVTAIRSDETWRTKLTGAQLRACDRIAGDLNRHFGYP